MAETNIATKLEEQAGLTAEPTALPSGTEYTPEAIKEQAGEILSTPTPLGSTGVQAAQASLEGLTVPTSTKQAATTYSAYAIPGTPEAVAAEGRLSSEAIVGDVQGSVSEAAIATAAVGELDPRATTQYQLGELFKSFDEGKDPPAWASPAMRSVTAMMQARGLGSSSMASAAMTQAIMEAGIPIAKADADKYAQIQLVNLTNQQQATLQNAMTFAAMDKANLDARMTAAVETARAFLNIDLANLNNRQKVNELEFQGKLQALLTDSAAENAARQFNAESQTQVDQFFAQLNTSIQTANANRKAAQDQFNVNEKNAMGRFVAEMNNQREQFNQNMRLQIDQSNAQWRRQINTVNTAADNEAARINAQNLFNMTASAQASLWQQYRDNAAWALQYANNEEDRQHQMALLAMEIAGNADLYADKALYDAGTSLGKGLVYKWATGKG
jgi:hypothetical protein